MRVTRGSFFNLKTGRGVIGASSESGCPEMKRVTYSLCIDSSFAKYIDLNFRNVNGTPYRPTRCCLNSTGPREVSLIVNAIAASKGERKIKAKRLPETSITLLTARDTDFGSALWRLVRI